MGSHEYPPGHDASRAVMDSLRRLVHGLRVFDRAAERSAGLSGAQLFVLSKLAAGGPANINELAQRTCTHQSSVSVVARKLVNRALAARLRVGADARQVRLAITPAGRRALAKAPAAAQDKLIAALARLSPADRRNLGRLLEHLVLEAGLSETEPKLFFEGDARPVKLKKGKTTSHA
jgi:DNA-binding MarR family transcriptional regulator